MSCSNCAQKFSFLHREHGCIKCGYSFCSKCLKRDVCNKCTNGNTIRKEVKLDDNVVTKLTEKPSTSKPVPTRAKSNQLQNHSQWSIEDQMLADRLEKLRNDRKTEPIPSVEEIEQRLSRLRGVDRKMPSIPDVVRRAGVDPSTALVDQISDEVKLDNRFYHNDQLTVSNGVIQDSDNVDDLLRHEMELALVEAKQAAESLSKDNEIMERLKNLKSKHEKSTEREASRLDLSERDCEEEEVKRMIEMAMLDNQSESDSECDIVEKELPWCVLCNEDAHMRCQGCDGDLYCRGCWKEIHKEPYMKCHNTTVFKP